MADQATRQEPQGIPFFSIKTGETFYAKLEPTISAFINSSDMGINASRDQDFGWRLAPDWVKKVKEFRRDPSKMQFLSSKIQGQKPTTVQILFHMYSEEVREYENYLEDYENPYEDDYQRAIADKPEPKAKPEAVNDIPETVDEADLMPADDEEIDTDAAAEVATSEKSKKTKKTKK